MSEVVGDPLRSVLGADGNRAFEHWLETAFTVGIVTKEVEPELLKKKQFSNLFKQLGVKVHSLKLPAEPQHVENTRELATVEWELAFTEEYVEKALCEHITMAISIAHLRTIRQCLADNPHKWVC